MPNSNSEELQVLRLIRAFGRIRDAEARRRVILRAEQEAERTEAGTTHPPAR